MSTLRTLLVLMMFTGATQAKAMLLFEPYVGYGIGNYKFTGAETNPDVSLQNITFNGNIDGFAYGAKAGFLYNGILLGAEYQGLRGQRKQNGSTADNNWTNTSIFGILGLQLPMGLRISAGMTVVPHRSEEMTEPESTLYTGSAKKLSIGFKYRVPIAFNVDYIVYKFEKFKQGDVQGNIKERLSKSDYSTILVSLSFPFEI